jgi:hypothetical protein
MFISGFQKYLQKLESVGQTILVLIFYWLYYNIGFKKCVRLIVYLVCDNQW